MVFLTQITRLEQVRVLLHQGFHVLVELNLHIDIEFGVDGGQIDVDIH
ncbi:hypothetical protein ABAC402_15795 [Asticcacaulis sp. AC402]|nr:hypothetical protein ABAC402_15795 [Asticcacaulis sp. AC402]